MSKAREQKGLLETGPLVDSSWDSALLLGCTGQLAVTEWAEFAQHSKTQDISCINERAEPQAGREGML